MYDPSNDVYPPTRYFESLARADALEREITDLCAQINAAGYRLLRLISAAFATGELSFSKARDGGCRFPGCTHHRFVDAHHIRHWANRGETSIDNLVLLCRRHHRLVHEGGFGVERTVGNGIRFSRPDGRVIEEHPRLPANGSVEGLRRGNRDTGVPIDAGSWIIPGETLDYGMAIEGLMWIREREPRACETAR